MQIKPNTIYKKGNGNKICIGVDIKYGALTGLLYIDTVMRTANDSDWYYMANGQLYASGRHTPGDIISLYYGD